MYGVRRTIIIIVQLRCCWCFFFHSFARSFFLSFFLSFIMKIYILIRCYTLHTRPGLFWTKYKTNEINFFFKKLGKNINVIQLFSNDNRYPYHSKILNIVHLVKELRKMEKKRISSAKQSKRYDE